MKNQDTHRNGFYLNASTKFCFFFTDDVKDAVYIENITPSSVGRVLKLIANKDFVYDPFGTTIYIRRKYANGY